MKSSDLRTNTRPKPRKFVLRPYRRIQTWLHMDYLSGDAVGKGVVTNLSYSGMRVFGDHALTPGTSLAVRVVLREHTPPVEISRATVRWVNQYDLGLQIEDPTPGSATRIAALLNDHAGSRRFRS